MITNKKNLFFLFIFCIPVFCLCVEDPFSATGLSAQIIAQVDPIVQKHLLIEGINQYNNQLATNSVFFSVEKYNLYFFQYCTLLTLKASVVEILSISAPNITISDIPDISKPSLPFWMSFIGFLSGWFCFSILSLWVFFKK